MTRTEISESQKKLYSLKVINTCRNDLEIFLSNIVAGPKVPLSKEVLNIVIIRHHLHERRR
jgi:hypothetical protein